MNTLIVIPFALPWDWSADYEKQTVLELSKSNSVIVYLPNEGKTLRQYVRHPSALIRTLHTNVYAYTPVYLFPFQRFSGVRRVNFCIASLWLQIIIRLSSTWKGYDKVLWIFSLQTAVFPDHFSSDYLKVYDAVDAFTSEDPHLKQTWNAYEKKHVSKSDITFANQQTLCDRLRKLTSRVYKVPIGFSKKLISHVKTKEPSDVQGIPHPKIMFVGNINNRIDFPFLISLIKETPQYSYVFVGGMDPYFTVPLSRFKQNIETLASQPNVYFLGPKPKTDIASYIRAADIGLIPYDAGQEFNRACFPMKTLEFFAMGIPVISTNIHELKRLSPYVTISDSPDGAKKDLRRILSSPWPDRYKRKEYALAIQHTWEKKVSAIRSILKKRFDLSI